MAAAQHLHVRAVLQGSGAICGGRYCVPRVLATAPLRPRPLCRCRVRRPANRSTNFVGFGDSTIDSGWYRNPAFPPIGGANFNAAFPTAVAQGAGVPTSRPGLMSSEVLAALFGVTAIPGNQSGGTNFATSGARNTFTNGRATAYSRAPSRPSPRSIRILRGTAAPRTATRCS